MIGEVPYFPPIFSISRCFQMFDLNSQYYLSNRGHCFVYHKSCQLTEISWNTVILVVWCLFFVLVPAYLQNNALLMPIWYSREKTHVVRVVCSQVTRIIVCKVCEQVRVFVFSWEKSFMPIKNIHTCSDWK